LITPYIVNYNGIITDSSLSRCHVLHDDVGDYAFPELCLSSVALINVLPAMCAQTSVFYVALLLFFLYLASTYQLFFLNHYFSQLGLDENHIQKFENHGILIKAIAKFTAN